MMTHPSRPWAAAALLWASACLSWPAMALDLQGHRGARGLAPENTLPSFAQAIKHGVTTLELDVAVTRDGVVVVHHDLALNPNTTRDAHGRWLEQPSQPIHAMSWAELQTYDVGRLKPGTNYARNYPDQQAADGTRIPRLQDLFAMVKQGGHARMRYAIETKLNPDEPDKTLAPEPFAAALVHEIRQAGVQDRVQIMSFDWRTLQVVQRIAPEIPTVYLSAQQRWLDNIVVGRPEGSRWTAGFQHKDHGSVPQMIKAAGGRYWSVFHGDLTAEQLTLAKSLGIQVLVWTVNDLPTMGRMLDLGVDGLITDRPDLAQQLVRQRQITLR